MSKSYFPVIVLALAFSPSGASGANGIGEFGAANATIEGVLPNSEKRVLLLGSEVMQDERISTSPTGSGQVIFVDQTTLSIAPNSDVVLDRYVYDPERSAGEIGLSLTRGAMRFVGGRITKKKQAIIETPTATIGIRGGVSVIQIADNGTVNVLHVAGEWTRITANGKTIDLNRTGAEVTVVPGQMPQVVGVASASKIEALYELFEGGGGGFVGTLEPDLAATGLESGVASAGIGELGGVNRQIVATSGASMLGSLPPDLEESQFENEVLSPVLAKRPDRDPLPPPPPPPPPTEMPFETSEPLNGVSGVAIYATDPLLVEQNVLATAPTIDPLSNVEEFVSGTELSTGEVYFEVLARDGLTADGELYRVPIDPDNPLPFLYDQGETPRSEVSGTSEHDPADEFTTAFYEENGEIGQVFFATGTVDQLGAPQSTTGVETRSYILRPDPFNADSDIALLDPAVSDLFENPPVVELRLVEEPGEGLFREDGEDGFAKSGIGALAVNGSGPGQTSMLLVGTGRIVPTSKAAPSGDTEFFGTVQGQVGSPATGSPPANTIEGAGALLATGDGSTLFGGDADNLVFASATRFVESDSEDYESTPTTLNSWNNDAPDDLGFAHVGDRHNTVDIATADRLTLAGADARFDGGYAGGLGRSRTDDGVVSNAYILHSDGRGVQMQFDPDQNEANAVLNVIEGPSQISGQSTAAPSLEAVQVDIPVLASFGFGGSTTQSMLVSDKDFLMRNRTTKEHGFTFGQTNVGGSSGVDTPPGEDQQAFRGALATTAALGSDGGSAVFADSVDTDHEYLRWGYWSGAFTFGTSDNEDLNNREERYHAASWVAGNRLDIRDANLPDSASFDGFAVVSVSEGNQDYIDGGGFSLNYDFNERSGTAKFSDLAGYDFEASVSGDGFTYNAANEGFGLDHYAGSIGNTDGGISGQRPPVVGTVAGSFFTDAVGNDLKATAGRIDFSSTGEDTPTISASGVFGGDVTEAVFD